jgi:hypothetical protein
MQCIGYIETRYKKSNGKPYKNGKPRRTQISTIYHTTPEEATQKGWTRCDGKLVGNVEAYVEGPCGCSGYPQVDVLITCTKCKFMGGTWAIKGLDYHQSGNVQFLQDLLNDYIVNTFL